MGPTVFFSQLVLVGLLWLCVLLYYAWPSRCVASQQRPITSRRKRSHEPTPFAGLTQKPHCALCAHEAAHPKTSPPVPPDSMLPTKRRPREVDTSRHFCPQPGCPYRGWLGLGNLRANGHPSGGPWQQFHCISCKGYFLETHGTLFHGKHVSPDKLVWAIAALAEGLGIRAVARVFEVDLNTVLAWLVDAADHLKAFSNYYLYDIHVTQVQLDELFALLSAVKDGDVNEAQATKPLSHSPHWVWVAMDPVSKLILTLDVGERTLAMAQLVVHQLVQVLAPACAPLLLSDGFREYMTALLSHDGHWVQHERRQGKGPALKPRWMPSPRLLYAQVVKSYRHRRIVGVNRHVVFGRVEMVQQILANHGWDINTSLIERLNLDFRQHVAAIGRRVNTLCKHETGLRQQLALFPTSHNFCLPHASLRLSLAVPEMINGTGSAKQWQPCTPAMAAGLTDHVWTLREVLRLRVPPWPQP